MGSILSNQTKTLRDKAHNFSRACIAKKEKFTDFFKRFFTELYNWAKYFSGEDILRACATTFFIACLSIIASFLINPFNPFLSTSLLYYGITNIVINTIGLTSSFIISYVNAKQSEADILNNQEINKDNKIHFLKEKLELQNIIYELEANFKNIKRTVRNNFRGTSIIEAFTHIIKDKIESLKDNNPNIDKYKKIIDINRDLQERLRELEKLFFKTSEEYIRLNIEFKMLKNKLNDKKILQFKNSIKQLEENIKFLVQVAKKLESNIEGSLKFLPKEFDTSKFYKKTYINDDSFSFNPIRIYKKIKNGLLHIKKSIYHSFGRKIIKSSIIGFIIAFSSLIAGAFANFILPEIATFMISSATITLIASLITITIGSALTVVGKKMSDWEDYNKELNPNNVEKCKEIFDKVHILKINNLLQDFVKIFSENAYKPTKCDKLFLRYSKALGAMKMITSPQQLDEEEPTFKLDDMSKYYEPRQNETLAFHDHDSVINKVLEIRNFAATVKQSIIEALRDPNRNYQDVIKKYKQEIEQHVKDMYEINNNLRLLFTPQLAFKTTFCETYYQQYNVATPQESIQSLGL